MNNIIWRLKSKRQKLSLKRKTNKLKNSLNKTSSSLLLTTLKEEPEQLSQIYKTQIQSYLRQTNYLIMQNFLSTRRNLFSKDIKNNQFGKLSLTISMNKYSYSERGGIIQKKNKKIFRRQLKMILKIKFLIKILKTLIQIMTQPLQRNQ